jgi:L-ascorbate metabolism protein UlaG (beta-lactamase superfamily)
MEVVSMSDESRVERMLDEYDAGRLGRRALLRGLGLAAGGLAIAGSLAPAAEARRAAGSGTLNVRWIGGGVVEVATPDDKQLAYIDAAMFAPTIAPTFDNFHVPRPTEFTSAENFTSYVQSKSPEAVLVLLTHDHADHAGANQQEFFDLLKALSGAGINVKATGQSDLFRSPTGLLPRFQAAGLDPAQIVVNAGAAQNFGGRAQVGQMQAWLVPAIHSNGLGFPAAGFILEMGGVRVYASGDTDLFGDMRVIGDRYHPDIALVCVGGGPFTMGPRDAALACQMAGVSQAVPIHYAHNAAVLGPEAASQFQQAVGEIAPAVSVTTMQPGETRALTV